MTKEHWDCPIISVGVGGRKVKRNLQLDLPSVVAEVTAITEDEIEVPNVIRAAVSDHDKGLKEAVQLVLPHMHATSCAVHIKHNVQKVYGQRAAANVIRLAKTFSLMESEQSYRRLSR